MTKAPCPRCQGTGKLEAFEYFPPRYDDRRAIELSCGTCKGTGKVKP